MKYTKSINMEFATEDEAYEYMRDNGESENECNITISSYGTTVEKKDFSEEAKEIVVDLCKYCIAIEIGNNNYLYAYGNRQYGYEQQFAKVYDKESAEKVAAIMRERGTHHWVAHRIDKLYK